MDEGVGIKKSDQNTLFTKIVQFNPGALQAGGGSGLGMMISKGITDMHGGTLSVWSAGEGHGTTFTLRLPLYSALDPPGRSDIDPAYIVSYLQQEGDSAASSVMHTRAHSAAQSRLHSRVHSRAHSIVQSPAHSRRGSAGAYPSRRTSLDNALAAAALAAEGLAAGGNSGLAGGHANGPASGRASGDGSGSGGGVGSGSGSVDGS